jgi:diacylglycerol O-acyltransferase / wax synthase
VTASLDGTTFFQRLPARDACFLAFERPDLHMHVGATAIFEPGTLRAPSGALDFDRITRYMESRLALIPRCRQRIERVPILRAPGWVDDPDFDVHNHIRLAHVAAPGGEAELQALAGELISLQLDRSRPLWEIWFVDGLADGRIAAVVKFHHCMADGLAAIEFTRRFLSTEPSTTFEDAGPWQPRAIPRGPVLVRNELSRWLGLPVRIARGLHKSLRTRDARRLFVAKLRSLVVTIVMGLKPPSRTPLQQRVGPERRFAWTRVPMRDIRGLRQHYGGSLNDVCLGVVSGGMSRVFEQWGGRARPPRVRAMAPTSALSREELHTELGNRVYAPLVDLHLDAPDAQSRMQRIQDSTRRLAKNQQGLGWDVMSDLAEFTGVRTQQLFMWLSATLRSYNVILTLVPGPHYPLYLLDAKLIEAFPILPLLDRQTVTCGIFRYTGTLHWGIVSTPEYAEHFPPFVPQLEAALAEYLAEARGTAGSTAAGDEATEEPAAIN